jgi:acyl dehydratase
LAVPTFYFEDFSPGWTIALGPRRITREEIIGFAAQFDPQPMHLDEVAAAKTMLGGLGASGWHTCAIMMKMIADGLLLDTASMGAPGIDEVKWMKPVRPGDSLTVRGSVLSARVSQSRKDRGFVSFHWDVSNDRGERVMTLVCPQMLLRRNADAVA